MPDTTRTTHDEKSGLDGDHDMERGEPGSPNPGSETATIEALEPPAKENHQPVHKRDFGLLPIPKHLRVSHDNPPKFDIFLNILFGIGSASGISLVPVCIAQLCETRDYGKTFTAVYSIASMG